MPIRTALWKVGTKPQPLTEAKLANEQLLQEMIVVPPARQWRMASDSLGGVTD